MTELLLKLRIAWSKYRCKNETTAKGLLQTVAIASVGVTAIILGVREFKGLQSWELSTYDQMLRLRPPEAPDPRILLVTITEDDIQREKWPLSDSTINRLLAKLQSDQPRVIGLDIYRPQQKNLAAGVRRTDNIISICAFSSMGNEEIAPPPNFPIGNVGFSDLISDDDRIVRRSLLFANAHKDKKCQTSLSFASLLATKYLEKQGIKPHFINKQNFQLGKTFFRRLTESSSSYEHLDAKGYQILLNYHDPLRFVKQVSLTQVLTNQLNPNLVKDRLVIIGTTARSVNLGFYTPYSASPQQPPRMFPVFIHAQVASQTIGAVLDGRPLIWYWSDWVETVWVWGWSVAGGVLAWRLRHPLHLGLAGGGMLLGLVGIGFILFLQMGWVPIIPPALALVMTIASVMVYTTYQTQQQTKVIILQVEKQLEAIAQLNILLKENTAIQDQHLHLASIGTKEKATGDELLSGRYKITRVLGHGGFGRTYLAEDTQRPGNPTCVVKQLMPARQDTKFLQVARRLFDAEAEILEVLGKHDQIPELLAYFEENREFYLVQEYIPGHTLSEELPPVHGRQKESWVIDMLKGILEVLAFVHDHRVIHRDIKPSNIIRRAIDNRLVLIDFGAVKIMQPPTSPQTELATVAIGTRGYAPPEQFVGHPRLSSDIYALGMIGIQAITGISPHELQPNVDTGTVVWRQWAQVSVELGEILDKMVRYHFSERYPSATAVLEDLKRIGQ